MILLVQPTLKVRRSSAGLGLFAEDRIKKGSFIIEYVGDRLPTKVANQKGGKYLFEVNSRITIDGSPRWNTARYINYSCTPNAEPVNDKGHIVINAIKNIEPGEEITYDYGKEYYDEFIKPHGCKCTSCMAGNKPRY